LVSVGRLSSQPAAGSGGVVGSGSFASFARRCSPLFDGIGSGLFFAKLYPSIEYIFKAWTPCGKKAFFLPCGGIFFKVAYIG
jgi:hypothetical protein